MGGVYCGGFLFLTEQIVSLLIERSRGQCVSCAFQQISCGFCLWQIKNLTLIWHILGNSLTSFEAKSFLLPLNDRLITAAYPAWMLSNFQQISCFVHDSTVTLGLARLCRSVSYYTTLHNWVIKWFQTRQSRWKKCAAFIIFVWAAWPITVGHLHLFLKNWQTPDNCAAGEMSMPAIDWVVIQLDYK